MKRLAIFAVGIVAVGCGPGPKKLDLTTHADGTMTLDLSADYGYHFGAVTADLDGTSLSLIGVGTGAPGPFQPGGVSDNAGGDASASFAVPLSILGQSGAGQVSVHDGSHTFSFVSPTLYSSRTLSLVPPRDPIRGGDAVTVASPVASDTLQANVDFLDSKGHTCMGQITTHGSGSQLTLVMAADFTQVWSCEPVPTSGTLVSGSLQSYGAVITPTLTACKGGVSCSLFFTQTVTLPAHAQF